LRTSLAGELSLMIIFDFSLPGIRCACFAFE